MHAPEFAVPDVDFPWPIKLLVLSALGWVALGPIAIFVATRRRKMMQGITLYAIGAVVGIATLMTVSWGWPHADTFVRRFDVLWRHVGFELLCLGLGLGLLAALVGRIGRRRAVSSEATPGRS